MSTKISVIGIGYVGHANALLLCRHNPVTVYDIHSEKAERLKKECQSIVVAPDLEAAVCAQDYVVIAVPTDYCEDTHAFDTHAVEEIVARTLQVNPHAYIVIKSTTPVGFCEALCEKMQTARIIFSPEFLREDMAVHDILNPSRIIMGSKEEARAAAEAFAALLLQAAVAPAPVFITTLSEAESIKLFSNAYLAMRVAFFNTLDMFCEEKALQTKTVIAGVCADSRIGDFYNNPSFGYGGSCLPKDTRQLYEAFESNTPDLIGAVISSNQKRKKSVADKIAALSPACVGIYRLNMKKPADNLRNSAVLDIAKELIKKGIKVIAFEPLCSDIMYDGIVIENQFDAFAERACVILANRYDRALDSVRHKVYTRDVFCRD